MANTSFWADSSGGGGITDLTGDVTATGPGSAAATISALAVTTGKLAANAVTTAKITDANVTNAKLNNTGSTAGRNGVEVLIQSASRTAQAVGTFATATWASGLYKQVRLVLRQTAKSTTGGINNVTGVGLTGTYKSSTHYNVGTSVAATNQASWYLGWANAIASGVIVFDLPAAPALKTYSGMSDLSDTATTQHQTHGGSNNDTTHEVTGLGIVTVNDTCDFSFELYGLPA